MWAAAAAFGRDDGWTGQSTVGCGSCHGSLADPDTAAGFDVPTLAVAPGATLDVGLVVSSADPTRLAAGMNVSATGGVLIAGDGQREGGGDLTHVAPAPLDGGAVRFTFRWTVPDEPGTYTLRGVGNAVNGNGLATGDGWALAEPVSVVVGEIDTGSAPTGDTAAVAPDDASVPPDGCGCTTAPPGGWALALAALLALRRFTTLHTARDGAREARRQETS